MLTCMVLHNMLRSHQGEADRPPTPADNTQPPQADQGEQRNNKNLRNDCLGLGVGSEMWKSLISSAGTDGNVEIIVEIIDLICWN